MVFVLADSNGELPGDDLEGGAGVGIKQLGDGANDAPKTFRGVAEGDRDQEFTISIVFILD